VEKAIPNLNFVTGANDKYFFVCGTLLQSLEEYFPGIPCLVLDFGLSKSQAQFFQTKNQLLKLPSTLTKTDHPYKLKSSLGLFLGGQTIAMPVWIDCDIIAVGAGSKALFDIARSLQEEKKIVATGPDYGAPHISPIREHVKFGRVPKFMSAITKSPEIMDQPYLNSGLIVFSEQKMLQDWQSAADLLEGDWLWEQYAFNLVCHQHPSQVLMLDSRIWNASGELLKEITFHDDGVYCEGQKCIFAHATSHNEHNRNVDAVEMLISKNGYACNTYLRLFVNPHLRAAQEKHLSNFLSSNFALLKDLNILFSVDTGRNEPCPCGSGKRFKHCHGVYF
jgi:hypothetical protein